MTAHHHTTASTTVFPTFDQFHTILATVKYRPMTNTSSVVNADCASLVLVSQKHIYNGIVFKLYELYGLENPPSKFLTGSSTADRPKMSRQKKSLIKAVTTPTLSENEPFLYTNGSNR
jgi:hypothetical protein